MIEHDELALQIEGVLPPELHGHVFFIGPARVSSGDSILTGDGLIHRLDLGSGRITSRIVRTPCWFADRAAAGSPLAFRNFGIVRVSPALGARNLGNTALVPFQKEREGERLLVTYDGGRPFEIDPATLRVITPVGHRESWRAIGPDMPFPAVLSSAHPVFDRSTGVLFTVNYGWDALGLLSTFSGRRARGFTYVVRWDGEREPQRRRLIDRDGRAVTVEQAIHQVGLTRRWLILAETSMKLSWSQLGARLPRLLERPQRATTVLWLVRRDDLETGKQSAQRAETGARAWSERDPETGLHDVTAIRVLLPLETVHFEVDFDDDDGIRLHAAHNCAMDFAESIRRTDVGFFDGRPMSPELWGLPSVTPMDVSRLATYRLDPTAGAIDSVTSTYSEELTWGLALYAGAGLFTTAQQPERRSALFWTTTGFHPELLTSRVHALYARYQHRMISLETIDRLGAEGRPSCLIRAGGDPIAIDDAYSLPEGSVFGAVQWVPPHHLCAAVASKRSQQIWVFDGRDLSSGPVARMHHPELAFDLTIHSAWLERAAPRTARYHVPLRDDLAAGPLLARFLEKHVHMNLHESASSEVVSRHHGETLRKLSCR